MQSSVVPLLGAVLAKLPTKRAGFRRALSSFEVRAAAAVWFWLPSLGGASASLSQSPLLLSFAYQLLAKNATDRCRNASLSGREALLCRGNPGVWEGLWGLTCPHDSSNKTSVLNKLQRSAEDAVSSHLLISSTDTDGLILKVRPPMASQPPLLRPFCLATRGGCAAPVQPKSSRQQVGFPKSTPNFQTMPFCFPGFRAPRLLHPSLQMSRRVEGDLWGSVSLTQRGTDRSALPCPCPLLSAREWGAVC